MGDKQLIVKEETVKVEKFIMTTSINGYFWNKPIFKSEQFNNKIQNKKSLHIFTKLFFKNIYYSRETSK